MENSSIVIFSAPSLHNYWRGAPPPAPPLATALRVDGRIRRFLNTMMSYLGCRTYDSKTLRMDAVFF